MRVYSKIVRILQTTKHVTEVLAMKHVTGVNNENICWNYY